MVASYEFFEEVDTKRNMEDKLLYLRQVFHDQGLDSEKQALEDLEWQIFRAEFLAYMKLSPCLMALLHVGMLVYLLVTKAKGMIVI